MHRRSFLTLGAAALAAPGLSLRSAGASEGGFKVTYFDIPQIRGSRDVTDAGNGRVWVIP